MRTTLPLAAGLAAVLASLAPARAQAGGWMLRAGAEYAQSDAFPVDGPKTTTPRLAIDLGLNAGGSLGGRGFLDWNGNADWNRSTVNGDKDVQDRFSYGLRSTLLGNPNGPLTLSGFATRRDQRFSTDGALAGSIVGNTYGGDLVLRSSASQPWVNGSYFWGTDEQHTLALGTIDHTVQSLTASTGFGAATFSYNASYHGTFSEGTFETDKYANHRIDVNADAQVAAATRLRVTDLYFVRDTPALSAINARQEVSTVQALLLRSPTGGLQQAVGYSYGRASQTTTGSTVERLQHRASYSAGGELPAPEWTLRGVVDATYDEDRQLAGTARSSSQALSALLAWRRARPESQVEVHGGPTVSVLEPERGDARMGWGATAGLAHTRSASVRTSIGYELGFTQDVGSDQGWTFRQSASGSADLRVGLATLSGTLQAGSERRQSPVFGAGASRNLTALGTWRMRESEVSASVGYQDGTSGRIPSGTPGDGLFIAPAYDSRTAHVQLAASTSLARFQPRARVRYTSTDLPDRPAYGETQLLAAIDYAYGALRIGVEDTYVVTDVFGGQLRVNQFMVRAYRTFGSRF